MPIFVKLEAAGITDNGKQQGFIEILSFSFGITNPSKGGGGAAAGKFSETELVVTKHTDTTSPTLMLACAIGTRFPEVVLTVQPANPGEGQDPFYKLQLGNVVIDSVQVQGNENGDDKPLERASLNFANIEIFSEGSEGTILFHK